MINRRYTFITLHAGIVIHKKNMSPLLIVYYSNQVQKYR